eukprot:TRINITY_DN16463_c0_g1_i1.p2 TRINITY_DN16463_c0_g1~~TRINITY_DN16463_c0_g1_i1.p2  ORF type:complete len:288 (+),score=43.38 TRINITY_DN16463_c0_g1_i1:54-917(+)
MPSAGAIVAATAVAHAGLAASDAFGGGRSEVALKVSQGLAYALSVWAVRVPGRVDGKEARDAARAGGVETFAARALLRPHPRAFAIWGVIFGGEGAYVMSLALGQPVPPGFLAAATPPLVAAYVFQSLWCAAHRPRHMHSPARYLSVALLGSATYAMTRVHGTVAASGGGWLFVPFSIHAAWLAAATLVNFNSSLARGDGVADGVVAAAGAASAAAAAAFGVSMADSVPSAAHALTLAWALGHCAAGVAAQRYTIPTLKRTAAFMPWLCGAGAVVCAAAAAWVKLRE